MQQIIIITIVNVLALIFLGWTFALVEKNEDLDTKPEQDRNDKWHKTKAIVVGLFLSNIAFAKYNFTLEALIFFISSLCLVPLVFNSSINLFKGNGFFYLSDEGFERHFEKKPITRIAYFMFFVIGFMVSGYILINYFKYR